MTRTSIWRSWGACLGFLFGALHLPAAGLEWQETELQLRPSVGADKVTALFRFRNGGPAQVRIVALRPSCECVTATADSSVYAAGESGVVRAEFELAGREGRQLRTITVETAAEPERPTVLTLMVDLPEAMAVDPRFIAWRIGESPEPKDILVVLAPANGATLVSVSGAEPAFHASFQPAERPGHFRVRVVPASATGLARATLRLDATVAGNRRTAVVQVAVSSDR